MGILIKILDTETGEKVTLKGTSGEICVLGSEVGSSNYETRSRMLCLNVLICYVYNRIKKILIP